MYRTQNSRVIIIFLLFENSFQTIKNKLTASEIICAYGECLYLLSLKRDDFERGNGANDESEKNGRRRFRRKIHFHG